MELNVLSNQELFTLRVELEKEMSGRGMKFDVGAVGEQLAIAYFNSTPGLPNLIDAPTGAKNIDALSRDGERYSIKTLLKAKKTGTIYPDEEVPEKQLFEQLLVVQLSTDYELQSIHRFSWEAFLKARSWDKRMNAWYISISSNKLALGEKLFQV
ncbi:MAG: hypothetical protein WA435_01720 [Gallionellaceae bacterium]